MDDTTIFVYLENIELDHLLKVLNFLRECSGLKINISETEIFPIRMDGEVVSGLLQNFPSKICNFPSKYLGLPLHVRKLRKTEVQPLIDKIGARLPGWKDRFLSAAGRETLVNGPIMSTDLPYDRIPRKNG